PGQRAASAAWIAERLRAAGVGAGTRTDQSSAGDRNASDAAARADAPCIECHATTTESPAAARGDAQPHDRIIAFGSFLTVADILSPRASSPDPSPRRSH